MDGQINWLGWLSFAKDVVTLGVAVVGVCVACKGLKTWQRQLKGSSQFDVAKRLMLKVYLIRQEIESCRSPIRYVTFIEYDDEGNAIPASQQQYEAIKKDMWDSFSGVGKAFNEIELLLVESDIVLDKKIRELFKPIKKICFKLRVSIREYLNLLEPKKIQQRAAELTAKRSEELEKIIYAEDGDEIQTQVDSAVAEIEEFIRPYIHG